METINLILNYTKEHWVTIAPWILWGISEILPYVKNAKAKSVLQVITHIIVRKKGCPPAITTDVVENTTTDAEKTTPVN